MLHFPLVLFEETEFFFCVRASFLGVEAQHVHARLHRVRAVQVLAADVGRDRAQPADEPLLDEGEVQRAVALGTVEGFGLPVVRLEHVEQRGRETAGAGERLELETDDVLLGLEDGGVDWSLGATSFEQVVQGFGERDELVREELNRAEEFEDDLRHASLRLRKPRAARLRGSCSPRTAASAGRFRAPRRAPRPGA